MEPENTAGEFITFAKNRLQEKEALLKAIDKKNDEKLEPLRKRISDLQKELKEKSVINNTPERQAISNEIKTLTGLINEFENPNGQTEPVKKTRKKRT